MGDLKPAGAETYINMHGERVPVPFQGEVVSIEPLFKTTRQPAWPDVERALDLLFSDLLDKLLRCPPYHAGDTPPIPEEKGVYLFTEAGRHLYVGRARKFRSRWNLHTRPSSGSESASFAFNISKEEFASVIAGLPAPPTRRWLSEHPEFQPRFTAAKARVRAMEFRHVTIVDDDIESIFEVYVARKLQAPFNNFKTH